MRAPWARRLLSSVSDRVFKAWGVGLVIQAGIAHHAGAMG